MARNNYSYQKYRREMDRKKKKEAKMQRKLEKKKAAEGDVAGAERDIPAENNPEQASGGDTAITY